MPALPAFFRTLVDQQPTPLSAAASLRDRTARELFTILDQAADLLGDGMGGVLAGEGVPRESIPTPITAERLKTDDAFAQLLDGTVTLRRGQAEARHVKPVQRALQAIGARVDGADPALLLPRWGADGDFGGETRAAVEAFQAARGLTVDGEVGQRVASELLQALADTRAPDPWAQLRPIDLVTDGARRVVSAARGIAGATDGPYTTEVDGRAWRYTAAHFGVKAVEDGRLEAPGRVSYGLSTRNDGYWKCNIFGGICVALADLPVPTFYWSERVRTKHYPRAERFGPRLAKLPGWTMVQALDHRDPGDETTAVVSEANDAEIAELLRACMPGDLLFVDHPGAPGNNGGHTRICVEAGTAPDDPRPVFAQASEHAAIERADGLDKIGGGQEIQFWLLRYTAS